MTHDMPLVTTIAVGLVVALVLGFVTQKLRLSPIVGYLLAGVVVGPHTPGIVADTHIAFELSEIGVALLMFGVGLHFHLADLMAVRKVAVPGAIVQSAVASVLGFGLAMAMGWGTGTGIVLGFGLSVASTVVLVRGLEDCGQLATPAGHIAVGWLIVEDLITVLALVMLPALTIARTSGNGDFWMVLASLAGALGKIALLVVVTLLAGGRIVPWLLTRIARTRSRELFTLSVMAVAIGIAVASAKAFGASMALGAFLAGMIVSQSRVSHQAASDALPMRDAFAVLFFVSIGMLFDPQFLLDEPWLVAGALAIILLGKPLAAMSIVLAMGRTAHTSLIVGAGLAQIGEFSFILATAALGLNATIGREVFAPQVLSVLVAASILSIMLNPLLFRAIPGVERWLRARPALSRLIQRRAEARERKVNADVAASPPAADAPLRAVVVGYGPVGRTVTRILRDFGIDPVVVELNVDTVLGLKAEGHAAIFGDASRADILRAAGLEHARYLIVTLPDPAARIPVIIAAKEMNPTIRVLTRARFVREAPILLDTGADLVSVEETEGAVALAGLLLREIGADGARIDAEARLIRAALFRQSGSAVPKPARAESRS